MAKKPETKVPETINSVEALQAKISAMREAQKKFATFTQEDVYKRQIIFCITEFNTSFLI